MKGDKLFVATIVMELGGLVGILIGYFLTLLSPFAGTLFALICFIILCIGLVLSLVAFCMMVLE